MVKRGMPEGNVNDDKSSDSSVEVMKIGEVVEEGMMPTKDDS